MPELQEPVIVAVRGSNWIEHFINAHDIIPRARDYAIQRGTPGPLHDEALVFSRGSAVTMSLVLTRDQANDLMNQLMSQLATPAPSRTELL